MERPVILSVIIVAYKSRNELPACLGSIPPLIGEEEVEVLVVDNSRDAATQEFVAESFPSVIYVQPSSNLGFGRGNNLGYSKARGRFILFLNPDTVCNLQALAHCVSRLSGEHQIGIISPKLVLADGKMDLACRRSIPSAWDGFCRATGLAAHFPRNRIFSGYNLTYLPDDDSYDVGAINGAFMMGRRDVFERVGVFDESFFMYGDDLDLCIRILKAGFRVVYDGTVQITHLKGVSVGQDYERMSRMIFDANRDVYLKHFNPRHSRIVALKYRAMFALWKTVALARARLSGYRRVRPV